MTPTAPLRARLFIFVSPAAVVGEGLAFEEFRIVRGRFVDQHEQNFSAYVLAFVVVPVVLGRLNSVSHKNNVGINIGLGLLRVVVSNVLVERAQIHGLALPGHERKLSFGERRDSDQGHSLHVCAVISGRLQAVFGELGGNIFRGDLAAALARPASLQQIVR